MLLDDLGLTSQALRLHLKARSKFLRAQDRVEKLRRVVTPVMNAGRWALNAGGAGACARSGRISRPFFFALLSSMVHEGEADLAAEPRAWREIVANELDSRLLGVCAADAGVWRGWCAPAPAFCCGICCTRILVTVLPLSPARRQESPTSFRAAGSHAGDNASVFAAQWRTNMAPYGAINLLSDAVARDRPGWGAEHVAGRALARDHDLAVVGGGS